MSDKIHTTCPECQKTLAVPTSVAGKKIRCPACKGVVAVPMSGDTVIPSAPPVAKAVPDSSQSAPRRSRADSGSRTSPRRSAGKTTGNRSARTKPRQARPARKKKRSSPVEQYDDDIFAGVDDFQDADRDPYGDPYNADNRGARSSGRGSRKKTKSRSSDDDWSDDGDASPMLQVLSGIGMMIGACVWFYVAYAYADRIYFYPPILFVIGLGTLIKGVISMFTAR